MGVREYMAVCTKTSKSISKGMCVTHHPLFPLRNNSACVNEEEARGDDSYRD